MGIAKTEDIFKKTTELYERFYDEHNLDENSDFGHLTRKQAIIEADYLNATLCEILEYIDDGGTDLAKIKAIAYDGLYESRI